MAAQHLPRDLVGPSSEQYNKLTPTTIKKTMETSIHMWIQERTRETLFLLFYKGKWRSSNAERLRF